MRKRCISLICLCVLTMLTGCWDRVEVNDLAIITAMAIDRVENEKIKVSVQLFIPRAISSGEKGEDPSKGSTFVREGIGDNLANAISKLQTNVPRRLFWGHCKVFFGEEHAKNGIRKEIDFLSRHPSPRGHSLIYVSKGQAKEILALVPPLERYSTEALIKLTMAEQGMKTTLQDIDSSLMSESQSVSIPYIVKLQVQEPIRKPHETIPIIMGAAIFKKDKMVGTLNMKETRGLLWLKDSVKGSTISIKPSAEEDGEISMTPTIGKIKFKPQVQGDSWIMNMIIDMEGDIVQSETKLDLMNERIIKELKSQFEAALIERISKTIEKLQQEYNADVVEFGKKFHQKYPKQWRKVRERWDEMFPEVKVKINVHAKVRRPGYIGPPAGLPLDEVEEK